MQSITGNNLDDALPCKRQNHMTKQSHISIILQPSCRVVQISSSSIEAIRSDIDVHCINHITLTAITVDPTKYRADLSHENV